MTKIRLTLQHPSNWSDFQDLCADLWREMMGDMQSHQNGRNGQTQNGVDFFGKYHFDRRYTGVQCKGKNGNYDSVLTTEEIDAECNKAVRFQPELGTFVMATTSPRDVKIQEHCRMLTERHMFPFSVDTWAWEDIEDEVQSRETLMNKYYPAIQHWDLLTEIKLARTVASVLPRIHAFFSRPQILGNLNKIALDILEHLAFEMATNAFFHGGATTFSISVDGNKIFFKDDGNPFNSMDLLNDERHGRGGAETLRYASNSYNLSYIYDARNILTIEVPEDFNSEPSNGKYSVDFNARDIFGPYEAKRLAIDNLSRIPSGTETLIVDISGKINPAMSMTYAFFDIMSLLCSNISEIKVYVPHDLYYFESLRDHYSQISNISFIIKE